MGSRHTAESLWEVLDEPGLPERTRLGPPGVDVHTFRPRAPEEAAAGLRRLAGRLESGAAAEWGGEADAAAALASLDPSRDRIVSYVGKLIVSKGVDLLLAAWPLVVARVPDARLVIVGFGTYRETLGRYVDALRRADLDDPAGHRGARPRAGGRAARRAVAPPVVPRAGWTTSGSVPPRSAAERVHFTGRLEHEDLPDLLPACEAQVMSSTFPEAFGMVAAEAAACGALPLSANHSGMAEVTATLAPALLARAAAPARRSRWAPARSRRSRASSWTGSPWTPPTRERARAALAAEAAGRYGWESVAEGVIAAAQGRLQELPSPAPPADSVPDP